MVKDNLILRNRQPREWRSGVERGPRDERSLAALAADAADDAEDAKGIIDGVKARRDLTTQRRPR